MFGIDPAADSAKVELDKADKGRFYELRDAVHNGFKAGLGSRQNAPAEWIGAYPSLALPPCGCMDGKAPRRADE